VVSVQKVILVVAALGAAVVSCSDDAPSRGGSGAGGRSSSTSGGGGGSAPDAASSGGSGGTDAGSKGDAPESADADTEGRSIVDASQEPSSADATGASRDSSSLDSTGVMDTTSGDERAVVDSGPDASAFPNVLFDDFDYVDSASPALSQFGWTLKSGSGSPGPVGAVWSPSNVSFPTADAGSVGSRVMRLTASTAGPSAVVQSEVCHQFALLEGTYAARVRFADTALSGASTNQVVQTFFMISAPSTRDMGNAAYSECDFEYLPNGAWGSPGGLWAVTWESYDYTDAQDIRNNQSLLTNGSRQGWHTLNIVVMNGNVVYTVDGASFVTHGGVYYPESPMAICFNLWFASGIADAGSQTWVQDVDWVLHAKGQSLTAAQAEQKVADLRASQFTRLNTIR
jgi:hypothetical protein